MHNCIRACTLMSRCPNPYIQSDWQFGWLFQRDDSLGPSTEHKTSIKSSIAALSATDFLAALQAANVDLSSSWFQQDDATTHTANATMELLHSIFGSRVISKDPSWPTKISTSCPQRFFCCTAISKMWSIEMALTASLHDLKAKIEVAKLLMSCKEWLWVSMNAWMFA